MIQPPEAVATGEITPGEFLKLNAVIRGWKESADMVQKGSPFFPPGEIDLTNWDPWSARNQLFSLNPATAAPGIEGDMEAMQAAYEAGLVFMGDIDIPIILWRHYLEEQLNRTCCNSSSWWFFSTAAVPGACWESMNTIYQPTCSLEVKETVDELAAAGGILDTDNPANPFKN